MINGESEHESGQALVELMAIIIICTMVGFGLYEGGVFFHNIAVLNQAMESAALYASHGAPLKEIEDIVYKESINLIEGPLIEQEIQEAEEGSSIYIEIWNPKTQKAIVSSSWTDHLDVFSPREKHVAPYMFWANGYEIRVAVPLRIGIRVPFVKSFVVEFPVVGSRIIESPNDTDRDGMMDSQEVEYLGGYLNSVGEDDNWMHPKHSDENDTVDSNPTANIDENMVFSYQNIVGPAEFHNEDCGLIITRACRGNNSPCDEPLLEIFNPYHKRYSLQKVISDNDSSPVTVWNGGDNSVSLGKGEYYLILEEDNGDSLEYDATGVEADTAVDDGDLDFFTDADFDHGIKIEDADGQTCDVLGFSDNPGGGELMTSFFEGEEATDRDSFRRRHPSRFNEVPVDTHDNTDDFTSIATPPNLRDDYVVEKPYDWDNDGIQDKFDPELSSGNQNDLWGHPLIGPWRWLEWW